MQVLPVRALMSMSAGRVAVGQQCGAGSFMGRRAATLASGRRVAELGACAITGDTAGGSAGSCLRPRPPTAAVLGMLAPWSPLLRRGETGRKPVSGRRPRFDPGEGERAAALAQCGAQDVHQRAHQGLGQGRQGEDVCASLPTRCAGSIARSPCKVHVLH